MRWTRLPALWLLPAVFALLAGCAPAPQIERGPESHAIPIGEAAFLDR
jgi:hypothetical protein